MSTPFNVLDPVGSLIANIQAQVGSFLQLKAKLLPYVNSPDPSTAQAAQQYMSQQTNLETQLPGMLNVAQNLNTGSFLSADTVNLGAFATALNNHMKAVESFLGPANVSSVNASLLPGLGLTNVQFLIGLGILGTGILIGKPIIGVAVAGGAYLYAKS